MSHKEEQSVEVEALDSIFPNEIEIIETEPFHYLRFTLKTERYDQDPETEAKIILTFKFTENYPDEMPEMEIEETENVNDENALYEFLKNTANENLGMPMVYTILSNLVEKLNKDNEERKIFEAKEKDRLERLREEEELKKFEGTRVTVESFLKWKAIFDKEQADLKKRNIDSANKKPTGKQLFERDDTLLNSDLQFINNEDAIEVDESLFQDLDELVIADEGEESFKPDDEDEDEDDDDEDDDEDDDDEDDDDDDDDEDDEDFEEEPVKEAPKKNNNKNTNTNTNAKANTNVNVNVKANNKNKKK